MDLPTKRPRRTMNAPELAALHTDLEVFRDSGCRLLIRDYSSSPLLVDRFSGHLVIGPSEEQLLGFRFNPEYRIVDEESKLPHIHTYPWQDIPETFVHIGHRDYIINARHGDLNNPRSLANGTNGLYEVPIEFLLKLGAVAKEV